MSRSIPSSFPDYKSYLEWLDELVEHEIDEFLDAYEELIEETGYINIHAIRDWTSESGQLRTTKGSWLDIYYDVIEHSDAHIPDRTVYIPQEDPIQATVDYAQDLVREDMACRMHEKLEERGFEVDG